ncbi:MAG: Gfo/Idh/MocA family oxidoreductase [Planctomycetota bacterium]
MRPCPTKNRWSRRQFLKRGAAAALGGLSAPLFIPARALGRTPIRPPSECVALGFIGVGGQGSYLVRSFLPIPEARIVAVADAFASRRKEAARVIDAHYAERDRGSGEGGCAAYGDFRELLARADIDAVIVATPDHWHVPVALAAVRSGKDVYVEKPLGLAVAWNQALRSTVARYGAIFQYGTQQRSYRHFRFVCELVRNGRIGQLERIEAWCPGMSAPGWYESVAQGGGSTVPIPVPEDLDYPMWLGPAPLSPYTADRCTPWGAYHVYDNSLGFIAGWGAHPLDIAQWGNDSDGTAPVSYEGKGRIPAQGLYDTIRDWDMQCLYANGVTLRFMDTATAKSVIEAYRPFSDHGTTFFGTEGWVSVDRGGMYAEETSLLESRIGASEVNLYESANHYVNFVDGVKSRCETVSPIGPAVQSDIISHLSDIAIRMGRKIRWDPEREVIVGDEVVSRLLNRALRSPWCL